MDCFEAIKNRRSVRSFLDRAVTPEQVETILEAAMMAPSSRNLQPWSFHVYLNTAEVEELGRRIKEWLFRLPLDEPFASPLHSILSDPDYRVFYGAPALILVIAEDTTSQAAEDCCMAAENILLAARAIDLGATWIGSARPWFRLEETKRLLKIPETSTVIAPIALGHPVAWPTAPERRVPDVRWCALPTQ